MRPSLRPLLRPFALRLVEVAIMMLAVATLCFAAQSALPGDPAVLLAVARQGESAGAAGIARARAEAGSDRPALLRYGDWLGRVARLDLGTSLVSRRRVTEELGGRAGRTLSIGALAVAGGLCLALPLGWLAGLRPGGAADVAVAGAAALFTALPAFLVGMLLVALLSIRLGWLPAAGSGAFAHLVLPALTLALGFAGPLSQVVRHAVRAAWGGFPVVFGELKGLTRWRSGLRHGLRNAAIPVAVATGLRCAAVLEGFVVVETLFNVPGLGELLVKSLLARDIAVVQGAALLFGLVYGAAGLAIDAACLALDPRRRLAMAR